MKFVNKNWIFLCFMLIALVSKSGKAQNCATIPTEEQIVYTRGFKLGDTRDLKIAKGIVDIPYQVHLVRQDDGQSELSEILIRSRLQELNEVYLKANIRFVAAGPIHYIDDSQYYDFSIRSEDQLARKHDKENVINIYSTNTIVGGYYGYTYHPEKKRKSRMFISRAGWENGSTFLHEMGHFFGLYHTHGKSKTDHEAISRNIDANNNGILDCYETGDELCDTPSDPNLSLEKYRNYCTENCDLKEKIPSEEGNYYEPQITNLMCYNQHSNCRKEFTAEQLIRISQTARYSRKNLRLDKVEQGRKSLKGHIKFYLKDGSPMASDLDINLFNFKKGYSSGNEFGFDLKNESNAKVYLTIINMDQGKKINKVFPFSGDAPYLQAGAKENPLDGYISLDDNAGREYVCFLLSFYPLQSDQITESMKKAKGTFSQRLYSVLGRQLLPLDHSEYTGGDLISFKGKLRRNEVLPVMLEMQNKG